MTAHEGKIGASGEVSTRLIPAKKKMQSAPITWALRNRLRTNFLKGWLGYKVGFLYSRLFQNPTMVAKLTAIHIAADGTKTDYGVLGYKQVTTAFVNFLVDQLQTETSEFGDFKFHDSGVGVTAENITDTDIETTDGESRATGSQEEGATANIYKSIGTIAYTTTKAITEHGLFSTVASTTLMDRTVFTVINVVNGDSIQFTYEITWTPGS